MSELTKDAMMHIEGMSKAGIVVSDADYLSILIPEGMKTQSLESMQEFKNRFSAYFKTSSVNDFAEYTNAQPDKSCFIDPDQPIATSIFDIGTHDKPLHWVHRSRLELNRTAIYKKMLKSLDSDFSQKSLAEFLEDNRDNLTVMDALGEKMTIQAAIDAIRHITISVKSKDDHVVKDMGASRSMVDSIEATNGGKALPAWVTFKCKPYLDLDEREFPMRISNSANRDEVRLSLTVTTMDTIIEDIQREFKELIIDIIDGSEARVLIGSYSESGESMGRGY